MQNLYYTVTISPASFFKNWNIIALQWASLMAKMESSLGWEDSLGEGMATHSSVLAWRIPWTEEPGGLQSVGSQRVRSD